MTRRRLAGGLALTALLAPARAVQDLAPPAAESRTPSPRFERAGPRVFRGHPGPGRKPFNVLCADMDRDGDPDLLINWHTRGPLELFENVGGRFRLRNEPGADGSGLDDNRGIPDPYADATAMRRAIEAAAEPGLFVWHDLDRNGAWHLYLVAESGAPAPRVQVTANQPIRELSAGPTGGIAGESADEWTREVQRQGAEAFTWTPNPVGAARGIRHLVVEVERVGTKLELTVDPPEAVVLRAGQQRVPVPGSTLELWKPDPHGIAWVDVAGSPEPDLFVTRGGLGGDLPDMGGTKVDRFYVAVAGGVRFERVAEEVIGPSAGRGRQLEWVDVDRDGRLELSIGNRDTPNSLLAFDPDTGRARERAAELGLDFLSGHEFVWFDIDGDGLDDQVFAEGQALRVARNEAGRRFTLSNGEQWGLHLPEGEIEDLDAFFKPLALHVTDFNNDGRLDLMVSGHGPSKAVHVFLREEGGFRDATAEWLPAGATGARLLLTLDVDNDSFEDAIALGDEVALLHNRQGRGFEVVPLDLGGDADPADAAASADVDGDGREDLILVTRDRSVFWNRTEAPGALCQVVLESPHSAAIGAVVRVRYSDGTVKAQRHGSARNTRCCQSLVPLRFGIPAGGKVEELEVLWPGSKEPQRRAIADGATSQLVTLSAAGR